MVSLSFHFTYSYYFYKAGILPLWLCQFYMILGNNSE